MWKFWSLCLLRTLIALSHHDMAVGFSNIAVIAFDTSSLVGSNLFRGQNSWRNHCNTIVSRSTTCQVDFCYQNFVADKRRISLMKNDASMLLSFSGKTEGNDEVQVDIVNNYQDISSLADLRYKEWIKSPIEDDMKNSKSPSSWVPSLPSFRRATAEVFFERKREGSRVFLAKMANPHSSKESEAVAYSLVVGAAELSPIEMKGAIREGRGINNVNTTKCAGLPLYITDVVTSSEFRRRGIGSALMNAVEMAAWDMGAPCVFLHVKHDNVRAMKFYQRLGYICVDATENVSVVNDELGGVDRRDEVQKNKEGTLSILLEDENICFNPPIQDKEETIFIDMLQLSINAGAMGQVLMAKPRVHHRRKKVNLTVSVKNVEHP